jgi:hypothetical protein
MSGPLGGSTTPYTGPGPHVALVAAAMATDRGGPPPRENWGADFTVDRGCKEEWARAGTGTREGSVVKVDEGVQLGCGKGGAGRGRSVHDERADVSPAATVAPSTQHCLAVTTNPPKKHSIPWWCVSLLRTRPHPPTIAVHKHKASC